MEKLKDLNDKTTEELIKIFRKNGNDDIRNEIILRQKKTVLGVVYRYSSWRNSCELSDLEQEAWIGIMRALDKYDDTYGVPFGVYANNWANQRARKAIYNMGRVVRTPISSIVAIQKIKETKSEYIKKFKREPTIQDIARILHISVKDIKLYMLGDSTIFSISSSENDSDESPGYDPCDNNILPDEEILRTDETNLIFDLINEVLNEREKNVLCYRLGLNDHDIKKLHEIAKLENITVTAVRCIFNRSLEKIKLAYRRKKLNENMLA